MAQPFTSAYLTKDGINMLTKAQSGSIELSFTKVRIGDGTYLETEKTISALESMTKLKHPLYEFAFSGKEIVNDTTLMLKVTIDNQEVTDDFNYNEIGIYASNKKTGEEHLYAIAVVKGNQGDVIPEYNGHNLITINQKIYLTVSNTATITINVSGVYVTVVDFETHKEDKNAHGIQDLINGLFGFKYASSIKSIINYIGSFFDANNKSINIPEQLMLGYDTKDKSITLMASDIVIGGSGGGGGTYTLPTATATRLGGVRIGEGIDVEADGTISTDIDEISDVVSEDVTDEMNQISSIDVHNLF